MDQPNIDVNAKDRQGNNVVGLLQMRKKYKYIDYFKKQCRKKMNDNNDDNNDNDWKLDETMINNELIKYQTIDAIIDASTKSDYKKLVSILSDIKNNSNVKIEDIINLVGSQNNTTALIACASSQSGFDKDKQTQGDNFLCFKVCLFCFVVCIVFANVCYVF